MSVIKREHYSRLFVGLSAANALFTLGLILFGAIVRVTDSGLGCGNEWPTCHGSIIPPMDNLTAWIEWLHRFFAVLIGLIGLLMLATAFMSYRKHNKGVLIVTIIAAVLFAVQSALGALVVILDLPPTMVTLHLGTAMLLLGALIVAYFAAFYRPVKQYMRDNFTALVYLTTILSLLIILTGALVRGSGATLACTDWPLCNGEIFPTNRGALATIHMLHRLAVVGLGVALVLVTVYAFTKRDARAIRVLAVLSLATYLLQAGVGAMFVVTAAAPVWGASHVGMAALTWAFLVILSTFETINTSNEGQPEALWQQQSEPITTHP